jgi:hypothetical protein
MSNPRDKEVSFGSASRKRLAFNAAKGFFDKINSPLNKRAVTIKIIPMFGGARNTGVKAKIFVRVDISAFVGIISARVVTDTNGISISFDFDRFVTDIFESARAVFPSANTMKDKKSFIFGAKWSTVVIEIRMSRTGIAVIKGDTHSLEVKIIAKHGVGIIFIKRRIAEKSMVSPPEMRVSSEKVQEDGFERGRITDFFINIRMSSFL